MTISAIKFNLFCDEFPHFRAFLTVRGIQRRSHLKTIEQELLTMFGLKKKEDYLVDKIDMKDDVV